MDASDWENYLEMKFVFRKTSFGTTKGKQFLVFGICPPLLWNEKLEVPVCDTKRQHLIFKPVNPAATRWQWRGKYFRLACRLRKPVSGIWAQEVESGQSQNPRARVYYCVTYLSWRNVFLRTVT